MDWTSPTSVTVNRRGKNRKNVTGGIVWQLNPRTKKFTPVNDPKPIEVKLTRKEKKKVLEAFFEIMGRKPTQEEILELVSEELKLKREKVIQK